MPDNTTMQLDPAKAALITVFSDTYIPLDEKKREEFDRMLYEKLNPAERYFLQMVEKELPKN